MDEIFGLNVSEYDNFGRNPPLYDIKDNFEISAFEWRNFKSIFDRPLFIK